MKVCCGICEVLISKQVCYPSLEVIFLNAEHQKGVFLRSPVEDLVSSDIEELAQKCSVSYKVCSLYLVLLLLTKQPIMKDEPHVRNQTFSSVFGGKVKAEDASMLQVLASILLVSHPHSAQVSLGLTGYSP